MSRSFKARPLPKSTYRPPHSVGRTHQPGDGDDTSTAYAYKASSSADEAQSVYSAPALSHRRAAKGDARSVASSATPTRKPRTEQGRSLSPVPRHSELPYYLRRNNMRITADNHNWDTKSLASSSKATSVDEYSVYSAPPIRTYAPKDASSSKSVATSPDKTFDEKDEHLPYYLRRRNPRPRTPPPPPTRIRNKVASSNSAFQARPMPQSHYRYREPEPKQKTRTIIKRTAQQPPSASEPRDALNSPTTAMSTEHPESGDEFQGSEVTPDTAASTSHHFTDGSVSPIAQQDDPFHMLSVEMKKDDEDKQDEEMLHLFDSKPENTAPSTEKPSPSSHPHWNQNKPSAGADDRRGGLDSNPETDTEHDFSEPAVLGELLRLSGDNTNTAGMEDDGEEEELLFETEDTTPVPNVFDSGSNEMIVVDVVKRSGEETDIPLVRPPQPSGVVEDSVPKMKPETEVPPLSDSMVSSQNSVATKDQLEGTSKNSFFMQVSKGKFWRGILAAALLPYLLGIGINHEWDDKLLSPSAQRARENQSSSPAASTSKFVRPAFILPAAVSKSSAQIEARHEALVHPALMAHKNPERVALLGSDNGSSLREVLKHRTIQHVDVVDENLAITDQVSESDDCSELFLELDSGDDCMCRSMDPVSCFDDKRVQTHRSDSFVWIVQNFGPRVPLWGRGEQYDVIIMDSVDLSSIMEHSDKEFVQNFFFALSTALTPSGVLSVSQTGKIPGRTLGESLLTKFGRSLASQASKFKAMKAYSESTNVRGGLTEYRILFKDASDSTWWSDSHSAEASLRLAKRAARTLSGTTPLNFFDEASFMSTYQLPSRFVQEGFHAGKYWEQGGFDPKSEEIDTSLLKIKRTKTPEGFHAATYWEQQVGFDPDEDEIDTASLKVKSVRKPKVHRRKGVFLKQKEFAMGSYIFPEEMVHRILVSPGELELLKRFMSLSSSTMRNSLASFLEGCSEASQEKDNSCRIIVGRPKLLSFVSCRPKKAKTSSSPSKNPEEEEEAVDDETTEKDVNFYDPREARNGLMHAIDQRFRLPFDVKEGGELVLECPDRLGVGWPSELV